MTDRKQFDRPAVLQFGDKTGSSQVADPARCAECERMLADALDSTLSPQDQQRFDEHMAACHPCSELLADARRGAAFLELLRTPAPVPPDGLLDRILAQTGDAQPIGIMPAQPSAALYPDAIYPTHAYPAAAYPANVVPFPHRAAPGGLRAILLQPRLAMTAAMAFFSLTLTMNLTGIHPLELRPSDLAPGSLKRDFYSANARVVQYYEGLRVVYELESRVHDLEDTDPAAAQPANPTPAAAPQQPAHSTPAPARQQPPSAPGTSRRENLDPRPHRLLAAEPGRSPAARAERTRA